MVFDRNTITQYKGGSSVRSGRFTRSERTAVDRYFLTITFAGSSSNERYWLDEQKDIIYEAIIVGNVAHVGDIVFVNQNRQGELPPVVSHNKTITAAAVIEAHSEQNRKKNNPY